MNGATRIFQYFSTRDVISRSKIREARQNGGRSKALRLKSDDCSPLVGDKSTLSKQFRLSYFANYAAAGATVCSLIASNKRGWEGPAAGETFLGIIIGISSVKRDK